MTIFLVLVLSAGIAILQSYVFGVFGISRIRYTRRFNVETCYAGDKVELLEVIENVKPLPVPWLRVESTIDASLRFRTDDRLEIDTGKRTQYHKSVFSMGPYRRIRRRHTVTCTKRGVYRLDTVSLIAGDLLGTKENHVQVPIKVKLTVYPQVMAMEDMPMPSHGWQGDITVRRWIVEDPFLITGVREYRSGDPMKHIHWKATAKTGSLQVYQHDYSAEQRLVVYLNVEDKETTTDLVTNEAMIEQGISYAATLVTDAIHRGINVGFGHNGTNPYDPESSGRLPISGGREHLLAMLTEMAKLELRCRWRFPAFLEKDLALTGERRDYILITAHQSEALQANVRMLQQAGHSVQLLMLEQQAAPSELESEVSA